jgi:hypothetical protein
MKTINMKNVQSHSSSSKITNLVLQPGSTGHEAHTAQGNFAFHCVTHHTSFPNLMIALIS